MAKPMHAPHAFVTRAPCAAWMARCRQSAKHPGKAEPRQRASCARQKTTCCRMSWAPSTQCSSSSCACGCSCKQNRSLNTIIKAHKGGLNVIDSSAHSHTQDQSLCQHHISNMSDGRDTSRVQIRPSHKQRSLGRVNLRIQEIQPAKNNAPVTPGPRAPNPCRPRSVADSATAQTVHTTTQMSRKEEPNCDAPAAGAP